MAASQTPEHDPALPVGVVEGFFGRPWTHSQRLFVIRLIASLGMNTYIYAPKEDPRHREEWREP